MLLKKRSGFTLVELMVVIVIIGVLASLAIPRFTEASDKAKVAEAPRILASYESAYLAALAEHGEVKAVGDLIFDTAAVNTSKWFGYTYGAAAVSATGTPKLDIGKFKKTTLISTYTPASDAFVRSSSDATLARKYVPNFMPAATVP